MTIASGVIHNTCSTELRGRSPMLRGKKYFQTWRHAGGMTCDTAADHHHTRVTHLFFIIFLQYGISRKIQLHLYPYLNQSRLQQTQGELFTQQ